MNNAINEFAKAVLSLLTSAVSANIPLVGGLAVTLLEKFIEQAQGWVDGDNSLTEEEKAKLKAVLENVMLKTTDDYLQEQGITREQVDQFIANLKSGS